MQVAFSVPEGWSLDRLTHVRQLGHQHYWRLEITDRKGRLVYGVGAEIADAALDATVQVEGIGVRA
jgi:hypothetical protein